MCIASVQKKTLDNYFAHLRQYGYMNDVRTNQILFSVLLLDTVAMFRNFVTDGFKNDIDKIMRRLDCCNCGIPWTEENLASPFYIRGQYSSCTVPAHTHVINDVTGLQDKLDELQYEIDHIDPQLGPDTVGTVQIQDGSIIMDDLNESVKKKMEHEYDESDEALIL